MKAESLLIMIVATSILVTPGVLTSPVLAQSTTDTAEGTTDTEEDGNQGTTGAATDDESPGDMYEEFQSCLGNEERTGGTIGFVLEVDIRTCFIDAGYTGTNNNNEDEDDNEEENEDADEETN
jgi:hypothetical protein